jgi:hypothetical protein
VQASRQHAALPNSSALNVRVTCSAQCNSATYAQQYSTRFSLKLPTCSKPDGGHLPHAQKKQPTATDCPQQVCHHVA